MSHFPTSEREPTGIRGFTQLIRPWNKYLLLIIMLVIGLALADMALPFALSLLVDDIFPEIVKTKQWNNNLLFLVLGSLCIIYTLRNVLFFVSRMLSVKVSEEVSFDLRQHLFDHLQQLGMSFYKTNQPGQISSRVMDDTFRIQTFIQEKLPTLLRYTIEFQILIVLLYVVNWKLAIVSTIVLPLHLWTYKKFYQPIRDSHHQAQKHLADAHGNLIETFLGAQVVKGFSAERREAESFLQTIRAGRDTQIRTQRIQFIQKVIADLLVGAGTVFLIGFGAYQVSMEAMSIGAFLMFFWYVRMLYPAVLEIISGMGHFSKTSASVDRILEMLEEPVAEIVHDMRTRTQALHFEGSIVFDNVSLTYDDETEVLRNINLIIHEGEHIAITGPSGSGKSSLISLLPRFNNPTAGSISVGGLNLSGIRLHDVRGMFGVAFQDAFLFNASIFDNLRYARPTASPQEIFEVCSLTGANRFIDKLPNGYETMLGDKGGDLSHGQKQRINLARALIRKPQTLIIDETTASIEADNAIQIITDILKHMQGRTVIIVTHDPAIMQLVQRVITLDNKTIMSDKFVDNSNMKHPTAKSTFTSLGALLLATTMFFGCSTTSTVGMIEMEEPKSTAGVIFEEDEPVDLVALADAVDAMLAKRSELEDIVVLSFPAAPTTLPTPKEISELISESDATTRTSVLVDLPKMNQIELNEILRRLSDSFMSRHGYENVGDSLDGVLPPEPSGISTLLTITKKLDGVTKIIRFGTQSFVSQPDQLWVEGFTIDGDMFIPNADAEIATSLTQELFAALEQGRAALSVLDLEKKIIQLSYVDAANAIKMLNSFGVKTFSNSKDGEDVPDTVTWSELPYVMQVPEPDTKFTGLVGKNTAISNGTTVPTTPGDLSDSTISSPMTQLIVIFDPAQPDTFSDIQKMLDTYIDRAARQVFIEAMVIEINEDGLKDIGVNWHMLDANNPTLLDLQAGKSNAGADGDTLNFTLIDLNLERAFTRFNEWWFDIDIRALVRDGKAEILSRPSVLTLNNRQASIRVGEDIPIATSTNVSNTNVLAFNFKYQPTGIMLNIRPRIANDGREVSMLIDTIVSSRVPGADLNLLDSAGNTVASAPTISSRRVQTYGIIPNNTPFIIGGLVNKETHTIHDKVPFLGDLPLIGGLFRADKTTTSKTEVIIVLTPHVLPQGGDHLSFMPKDHERFDNLDNELFRNSYRLRKDDIFDLAFINNHEKLQQYRDYVSNAIQEDYRLVTDSSHAPFANGHFPGESVMVTRMIYEVIKENNVHEPIQTEKLLYHTIDGSGNRALENISNTLANSVGEISLNGFFRDNQKQAVAIVFEGGNDIPQIGTLVCEDRATWQEQLLKLNQNQNQHAIIISEKKDLDRLHKAVALKHFLEVNSGEDTLTLNNFKAGQYVMLPELHGGQVHIIDEDVAKYFYQTEHYYNATIQAINEAMDQLDKSIQESPLN